MIPDNPLSYSLDFFRGTNGGSTKFLNNERHDRVRKKEERVGCEIVEGIFFSIVADCAAAGFTGSVQLQGAPRKISAFSVLEPPDSPTDYHNKKRSKEFKTYF
jgi:hypothetical protein